MIIQLYPTCYICSTTELTIWSFQVYVCVCFANNINCVFELHAAINYNLIQFNGRTNGASRKKIHQLTLYQLKVLITVYNE